MRALGVLFVLVLVITTVGWFRGWFGVQTSHAGDRDRVDVVVDRGKIEDDARAAADRVGEITGRAADALKKAAQKVVGGAREVTTEVLDFDATDRRLRVRLDGEDVVLTLPEHVPILAADETLPATSLPPGARVRITLADDDDRLRVTRVERL
jgi:hypothetical protein